MTRRFRALAAIIVLATIALAAGSARTRHLVAADLPPDNDNFQAPRSRSGSAFLPWSERESTSGATLEAGETSPCGAIGATVWFSYMSSQPATIEVSTAGSDFDTIITAYTPGGEFLPSPPGGGLRSIECNDDSGGQTSLVTFAAERNQAYYIQVGGKDGATGMLSVSVRCVPFCRPDNDDFQNATSVSVDAFSPRSTYITSSEHATLEADEPRPCGNMGATVWFRIWRDSSARIVVDTHGSDFDTALAVYGPGTTLYPSPPGSLSATDCSDDSHGAAQSELVIQTEPWTDYWLQVGGKDSATGQVTLNLACDPGCPPGNDDIVRAYGNSVPMEDLTRTQGATLEAGEPRPCGGIGRTVWYEVVVTGDATVVFSTAGSDFDTVVAAYMGEQGPEGMVPARNIACSAGAAGAGARIEFAASAMTSYLLQVGGREGAWGELHIAADCASRSCPPYNDSMSSYGYLFPGSREFVDTTGATVEEGEAHGCGVLAAMVWYLLGSYDGGGGRFRVSSTDSDYSAAIAVYRRRADLPEAPLSLVTCGDTAHPDVVEFDAEGESSGWQYLLQVGSRAGSGGGLQLRADCIPSCSVDVPSPPPDAGHVILEPATGVSGPITLPGTGSGGYLPGAR